ncbi:nuclear transport factor 2 family protein [Lentibacter algarum]|uniref:nuclear transport factor 2 family protein n=1 Tax=Lentibacter algarum TaxID=576131 RepID=UPI001C0A0C51|nr:nuclear transport factor 2 family protein [Lentibacter algarum]MBU2982831.1 nuclear transport factor 2 family protein [Lentibacter algarum]
MTPTEIVLNTFAAIFINFDPQAAETSLAPDYIQHSPAVPNGAAPILGFIPALKESGISVTTHRTISEDNLVVLHNTYDNAALLGADTLVAFDVFRVDGGKVVEHWDNLTPVTAPNPSGRSQTDGVAEITDLAETAANKALVTGFVETILMNGQVDQITDFISTETYIQHNSNIADGLDGLGAALGAMAEQGISMVYTDLNIVVAEGNFVFTASAGKLGDTPTAFFDLFRVENNRIVEHWDVVSDIPAEMAHDNGKF